jgi:spore maturation protein CgeB
VKVLVTGFEWFGDLVPFVVRALTSLGHEVSVVATNEDLLIRRRAGALSRVDAVPIVGHSLAGRWRTQLVQDATPRIGSDFRREVDRFGPDVILSILCWGEPLAADVLEHAAGVVRIGWLMDDPFGFHNSRIDRLLRSYDRLYTPDEGWSDNVERLTGRRPVWLPCGADPDSHMPLSADACDSSLSGHVAFVGSSCVDHPAGTLRRRLIESLEGLPVAIFGDEGWVRYGGYAAQCYRGGPVDSTRANVIYGSSAIALNFHHPQFKRGTSLRTFALCCSGALQIVDWRDGLDRWFVPAEEIETFRTPTELRATVERCLRDAAGRTRVARAGRARVLREHTYRHRLAHMLDGIST